MRRALLLVAAVLLAIPAEAAQVSGPAKAIDSTTIEIGNQRIMLFGLDSVMRKQGCLLDGKPWRCWDAAVQDLQGLLDRGTVTCDSVGEPDVYGRLLARCSAAGLSVNEALARQGFAVARPSETTDYVDAEADAKARKVGLWQGKFVAPGEFRRMVGIFVERP